MARRTLNQFATLPRRGASDPQPIAAAALLVQQTSLARAPVLQLGHTLVASFVTCPGDTRAEEQISKPHPPWPVFCAGWGTSITVKELVVYTVFSSNADIIKSSRCCLHYYSTPSARPACLLASLGSLCHTAARAYGQWHHRCWAF